ncbi:MAG: membrane protein [Aquirhabdus sp.]
MSNYTITQNKTPANDESGLIIVNHVTYALYLFSFFTVGLTWLVAIIINYVKRSDANGTWLQSHFDWQINTFWYGIIMAIIATMLIIFGLPTGVAGLASEDPMSSFSLLSLSGLLVLAGAAFWFFIICWHLYRIIRGWLHLASKRTVP